MKTIEAYRKLVEKRKTCSLCKGLRNPATVADGRHDRDQIGPWSLWQANLNSDFVVVGQDWGDILYFEKWGGRDQPSGNPTNENLQKLLKNVGIEIGRPRDRQNQVVFLTNLILCLKTGGLQGRVDNQWFTNCSRTFFRPLVEIIRPSVIIALGKKVSESILALYDIPYLKDAAFSKLMSQSPYQLTNSTVLFPVYHCGAGSVNRNRQLPEQEEDWSKVYNWLKNKEFR
jgi:uracil-DNA glycosylase family 4